jgi:hypothetical protein
LPRFLIEALEADRLEIAVDRPAGRSGPEHLSLTNSSERVQRVRSFERRLASQQFVEDGAQPVDIGQGGHVLSAAGLFGGHVTRRSQYRAGVRQAAYRAEPPRQTEVRDVWLASTVEQYVGRFEVTVQDAPLMSVGDSAGDLSHEPGGGSLPPSAV